MKSNLKHASMLLTGILVGGKLFAQTADTSKAAMDYVKPFSGNGAYNTWSFGINAGILTPNTIFGSNNKQDFTSPNANLGYGAYIKYQVTPAVGFSVNYLGGKLTGDHGQTDPSNFNTPYQSFSTQVQYAASINTNITVGNISWKDNKSAIQPYLTLGVGTMGYKPFVTFADGTVTQFKTDNNGMVNELFLPVGVGLKFNVARGINIDLGYQVNFVYSDNLDGFNYGPTNDRFSYAHAGLEFALGSGRKPQLATHNPVSSMRQEYMWENQNTRSTLEAELAAQKAQNDQLKNDLNAANANFAKLMMDSDGDGVSDYFDKCPNTPKGTPVDGSGCPLPVVTKPADTKVYVTEEDRRVVNEAVRNLEFDFNKATIREHSFATLDQLAQLLINKHFNLKLAGYTDNVGSQAFNLRLSKDRAQAVKTYLVGKGVIETQIQSDGFGKANPIATNKTAAGRQLNRRVEFSIF